MILLHNNDNIVSVFSYTVKPRAVRINTKQMSKMSKYLTFMTLMDAINCL